MCCMPGIQPYLRGIPFGTTGSAVKKSTLVLQMWIKQVLQQERLTDIARQKAVMAAGSIVKFLRPRVAVTGQRQDSNSMQWMVRAVAGNKIVWWLRHHVRFRFNTEMPRMGIGDPG